MDGGIADAIKRAIYADPTRRQALTALAATPLALALRDDAEAKKKGKKKGKKGKKKKKGGKKQPQPTAQEILRRPPFAPTDISLFTPGAYPDAPPLETATSGPVSEQELRELLAALLNNRFGVSSQNFESAIAVYDADSTSAIVPDPRLRAALAALAGTIGDATVGAILEDFSHVEFVNFPSANDREFARSQINEDTQLREIIVNDRFQFEDWRIFLPLLLHESLHQDAVIETDADGDNKEELAISTFETICFGQLLLESQELASAGTELIRRFNTRVLALLNSRFPSGRVRLFGAVGSTVFPGGIEFANWGQIFPVASSSPNTPGNPELVAILREVVGPQVSVPDDAGFDDATLALLDEEMNLFSAAQWVELAKILKLNLNTPASASSRIGAESRADLRRVREELRSH